MLSRTLEVEKEVPGVPFPYHVRSDVGAGDRQEPVIWGWIAAAAVRKRAE